jgi:hypothetical protein
MRRTVLVTVLVALQLAACGGNSNGDKVTTTDSSTSPALSNTVSTGSSTTVNSSIASPPPSPATGSFKLHWVQPVSRSDGSPLLPSEIDGFRIYLGKKPGTYPTKVNVTDGSAQYATVTNLAVGTYYLVMTAYDTKGRESGFSPVISKTAL